MMFMSEPIDVKTTATPTMMKTTVKARLPLGQRRVAVWRYSSSPREVGASARHRSKHDPQNVVRRLQRLVRLPASPTPSRTRVHATTM